ncbi:uncharacterized protein LOC131174710 [Hevea brasiliensis]|uniref:uncharacterized protein LOC131174710 n=1 Tax=Hevea brasiliensis TaxID=3981 RepID=UPI0025D24E46|nr:uncharacterized protein LOC131174710 [Hevea brasiliensis]
MRCRCETTLQPGFNCTVLIERTRAKARRRQKKTNAPMQNNVIYSCHFCSHKNLKRGAPKGHVKEICPYKLKPKPKPSAKTEPFRLMPQNPAIASVRSAATLFDAKKRESQIRMQCKTLEKSESSNAAEHGEKTVGESSKRKRKSWTSRKEITDSNEHESTRNINNLTIPFFI